MSVWVGGYSLEVRPELLRLCLSGSVSSGQGTTLHAYLHMYICMK